ncbi:hypothetical protein RA086_14585 [Lactiplantibacillus sp. WILCCON 0030]|uniref:Uncharacterized protein n=1 Tax=Lactiplantibacillus brownii TaxID=3069269 RepID=A0ABU1AF12_9LACO|nr:MULTISPECIES: hypothetical protein [Lactiplantibacillus]MCW6101582.1 hypothetical protein [Lactiplantibacillus plantarum]MCW6104733.1 hypothetical protein [Lactiplantibacillus plantarum]MDQ7938827.1 hypothetical protein [Lactiplantibacillus brownii]
MDYTEINQKLESAFNKTSIQKYDVCQLWSCLSCDLLYDLKKDQYAFPVVGSMKFINKITNQHGEYIYNNQNGDFHVVTFFCKIKTWSLLDFSTKHLSVKVPCAPCMVGFKIDQVSLADSPVIISIPELNNLSGDDQGLKKVVQIIPKIKSISKDDEKYLYEFKPDHISPQLNPVNETELESLEDALGLKF